MLFVYPMWDNEMERIGMQKCTPMGYTVHAIGEIVGFIGLLVLVGTGIYLAFIHAKFWLLLIPLTFGIVSEIMVRTGWFLAWRRGFKYSDGRIASWYEDGKCKTYPVNGEDAG